MPPAVPPRQGAPTFARLHYDMISRFIDGVSVMTYDASECQRGPPLSSLNCSDSAESLLTLAATPASTS